MVEGRTVPSTQTFSADGSDEHDTFRPIRVLSRHPRGNFWPHCFGVGRVALNTPAEGEAGLVEGNRPYRDEEGPRPCA